MKTFVTLIAILLAMVFVVPAFAGEEPYKAAVWKDKEIPDFHISPKVKQFTHYEWNTDYYDDCTDVLFEGDGRITPDCEPFGNAFECPSACTEHFKSSASSITAPEVCCSWPRWEEHEGNSIESLDRFRMWCPDKEDHGKTALIGGSGGEYEWVIALPKKPEGELNLEIQCGVLKPNSIPLEGYDAINVCAAITGEPVGPNCTRLTGQYLNNSALPRLEVIAHPGCMRTTSQSRFSPFHLTALRNPSTYNVARKVNGSLANAQALQVLDGKAGARIALKACMEKTVLVKWPVDAEVNALGETERALEAGDLIKVRMIVPNSNTVNLYCGKYSVTIGGIGDPETILDANDCDCISDANCQW
jgi:hypothetical protein